ncbi:hypothetical protein CPB85DRAFT_1253890 [Mucidula mucida]|nr:hypothetical protein CPB85DRAFT_1253890 [Mucidula mucida]
MPPPTYPLFDHLEFKLKDNAQASFNTGGDTSLAVRRVVPKYVGAQQWDWDWHLSARRGRKLPALHAPHPFFFTLRRTNPKRSPNALSILHVQTQHAYFGPVSHGTTTIITMDAATTTSEATLLSQYLALNLMLFMITTFTYGLVIVRRHLASALWPSKIARSTIERCDITGDYIHNNYAWDSPMVAYIPRI